MSEQAVRARAREAGLAVDWVDAMGRPQQVNMGHAGSLPNPSVNPDLDAVVGAAGAIPFTSREPGRDRRVRCEKCSRIACRGLHIDASMGGIADAPHEIGELQRNALSG